MFPPDLPLDDYDWRRIARRDASLRWITRLNRAWLGGQLATAVFLCFGMGPAGWWAFLITEAAWGVSLAAAGGSAGVALWNWGVLPGVWRVVGLAPWAILLMEVTAVVVQRM